MNTPIKKEDLINDLKDILNGKLGSYFFPNLQPVPAIAFLPDNKLGYNYPPADIRRAGIECVIIAPRIQPSKVLGPEMKFTTAWQIFLKEWDIFHNLGEVYQNMLVELRLRGYDTVNFNEVQASEELGVIRSFSCDVTESYIVTKLSTSLNSA